MSVTQKQIAQKLNVSQPLVARALKGDTGIPESTRRRVRETAAAMRYDPEANQGARALIARRYGQALKTGILAVLVSSDPNIAPYPTPYFMPMLNGMEDEAAEHGMDVCLCPVRSNDLPRLVREQKADGAIFHGHLPVHSEALRALGLPIVAFQSHNESMHGVTPDDRDGARQATRHLLERGHRRIAFLGVPDPGMQHSVLRLEGYLDAMREYGIEVPAHHIVCDLELPIATANTPCTGCGRCAACAGFSTLVGRAEGQLKKGALTFSAIVCHNDPIAMGVVLEARRHGLAAPADFSVTGFDNVSAHYGFDPQITSVDFSGYEMGREAVRILQEAIQSKREPGPDGAKTTESQYIHRMFPVALAKHGSVNDIAIEN